ncbi:MAG: peptidoglycan DD-metalloendopeptidase family protein [Porticoccaceae bacterium]
MSGLSHRLILCCLLLLAACAAPKQTAKIESRPQPPTQQLLHHWVDSGETLYSIAWRYGLDYRQLARINGLSEPYRLQRNQRLSLDVADAKSQIAKSQIAIDGQQNSGQPKLKRKDIKPTVTDVAKTVFDNRWQWPATGRVVKGFSKATNHQGIALSGAARRPVKPAAAGVVVYAGEGLRGYGKLIIIKHNDLLLSAYGHNAKLNVQEGAVVDSGTQIALAADAGQVYFEIRRDGQPVDPLTYLPDL